MSEGDKGHSQSNNAGQEDPIDEGGEDNGVIDNPCDPTQKMSCKDELHEKNSAPKLCDKETSNAAEDDKGKDSSSSSDKTDCEKMGSKRTEDAALNVADGETFQSSSATDKGILTTIITFLVAIFRCYKSGLQNNIQKPQVKQIGTQNKILFWHNFSCLYIWCGFVVFLVLATETTL